MMVAKRWVWALCALMSVCVVAGCASTTDIRVIKPVQSETLPQKTFAWARGSVLQMVPESFGDGRAAALSDAITASLLEKGYVLTRNPNRADLLVSVDVDGDFNTTVDRSRTYGRVTTGPVARPPHYRRSPGEIRRDAAHRTRTAQMRRPSGKMVKTEVDSTVVIDIQDRSTRSDLWKGEIRKTLELSEIERFSAEIDDDVAELFEDFPPSSVQ